MGNNRRNKKTHSKHHNPSTQVHPPQPKINQQQLQIQCLQLYELLTNKTKILKQQKLDYCYLISTRWLEDWKQYVGYYHVEQNDQKKTKKIGKKYPGKINYQLVESNKMFYQIPQTMSDYQFLNVVVSEKKQKYDDFIAIAEQIWVLLANRYDHIEIKRPKKVTKKGSILFDGSMLQLDVMFVDYTDKQMLFQIENSKNQKKNLDEYFTCQKMQLSTLWTLIELNQFISQFCQNVYGTKQFKISKGQGYMTWGGIQREVWDGINSKQKSFPVSCRALEGEKYNDLDLDDFIKNYYTLVIQVGKSRFYTCDTPQRIQGYCQQCVKKKTLQIKCLCGQMFYCSQECRSVDQIWHQKICGRAFDSEDDDEYRKKRIKIGGQYYGKCGLKNLGNTCYMNSVIQGLLSVSQMIEYFTLNQYVKEIDQKEYEQNKGRLVEKYSKTCKILLQTKDQISPWSLKGQVNYFLPPFQGFKQHDANDFLINLITSLNDQLKKDEQRVYHRIFEQNLIGQFKSSIKCPQCAIEINNDEIFTQISLPIKHKVKKQIMNYVIYLGKDKIIKGKCFIPQNWLVLRKQLNLKDSCLLMVGREGQNVGEINEDQAIEKVMRKVKKQFIFYPNCEYNDNDQFFSVSTISMKNVCGNQMKAPYGYPGVINIDRQLHSVVSFLIEILKEYCEKDIICQAIKIKQNYEKEIQEMFCKESQSENSTVAEEGQTKQNDKGQKVKRIQQNANNQLKQLLKKNRITIFVNDLKKNRNFCFSCKKKCNNGCQLPIDFNLLLFDYFDGKNSNDVSFQIFLSEKVQQTKIIQDKAGSNQTNLNDCMQLFTEPQQLDEENAWYCVACDNMRLAYKQLTIKRLPRVLIIHLNRFKSEGDKKVKNSQPIEYQQVERFYGKKYQLLSSIVHQGSTEGGHYWAICRRNEKYYIFNDSKVSQTDKICNKNAYILIYRCIEQKQK